MAAYHEPMDESRRSATGPISDIYAAALFASPRTASTTGEFSGLSELTSLKTFVTTLAGHIAAEAARS